MVAVVGRRSRFTLPRASCASAFAACVVAVGGCAGVRHQGSDAGGGASGGGAAGARMDAGVVFPRDAAPAPTSDGPASLDLSPTVVGGAPLGDAACAAQSQTAEKLPLDMYVMLDSSGSMTETTSSGQTKWDAISLALTTFVNDPSSAGIGVGLQYFPLTTPGVPDQCGADGDCGTSGPCGIVKTCAAGTMVTPCAQNSDCGRNGTCIPLGVCALSPADNLEYCVPVGSSCGGRGNTCLELGGYCDARDLCTEASYATPAVEVAALPGAANAIVASLMKHQPDGLTPTSGALTGALTHAAALAKQNTGHRVVVLLATDGLPDECTPNDIAGVASIAASALAATPSISTFVIGVFAPTEAQDAQTNLDAIAAAGGTKQSFVINLGQNVEQQFLTALNAVRTAALSCEFKVPTPAVGQALNYFDVNVQYTSGAGKTVTIGNVANKAACDSKQGGWYYDVDPNVGTPQNISICDTTCAELRADSAGSVETLLGCKTQAIIP
jgi:hypothetical protein